MASALLPDLQHASRSLVRAPGHAVVVVTTLALAVGAAAAVVAVAREALSAAAVGAVAGLVVAAGVGRLLRSLLVGVAPIDPLTLVFAALVDPAAVLRQE